MKLLKGVLTLAIVFALAASFAEADGKKANCEICVTNRAGVQIGVIIDPDLNKTYTNEQEFLADGGVILNPGEEKCFEVKAGDHVIAAGVSPTNFETANTSCSKNEKQCFGVYTRDGVPAQAALIIRRENCNGMNID